MENDAPIEPTPRRLGIAEGGLHRTALLEIVERIVRVAAPKQIILFGSVARGEDHPRSDFDLLVVTRGDVHRGRLTEDVYEALIGVGHAVDIVVVAPDDIVRYGRSMALVIATALREEHEVYAAAA